MENALESICFSNKIVLALPGKIGVSLSGIKAVNEKTICFCEESIIFISCHKLSEWHNIFQTFVRKPAELTKTLLIDSGDNNIEYTLSLENLTLKIEKKVEQKKSSFVLCKSEVIELMEIISYFYFRCIGVPDYIALSLNEFLNTFIDMLDMHCNSNACEHVDCVDVDRNWKTAKSKLKCILYDDSLLEICTTIVTKFEAFEKLTPFQLYLNISKHHESLINLFFMRTVKRMINK